jgi:NADPH:quinone reductase
MKAIQIHRFGGPEVLRLEQVSDPAPSAGQVVVRVRAVGVNPVETYIRSGIYGQRSFPFTPGADAAGPIEAIGSDVQDVKIGDRVYTSGTITGAYAELALCEAKNVHPLPQEITFQQGAALGVPYGTAYRALFQRGQAQPGETVLIHGASGGVGIAAVQFARAAGLVVIGTAGSDRGRVLVLEQGAHHVLDHSQANYLEELMQLTDGRGVELVMEMLANVNLGKDLEILAKKGRVVVIGSRGPVEINPRNTMSREADIRGMILFAASESEHRAIHAAIFAGLENRILRPVIGTELPLAEAPTAHKRVMAPGAYGKIVLIPNAK